MLLMKFIPVKTDKPLGSAELIHFLNLEIPAFAGMTN